MIIPGMVSATFKKQSTDFVLDVLKEAGLSAVEWSEGGHIAAGDESGARHLYDKTMDSGIRIAAYGSYYRLGQDDDPAGRFRQSLVCAAALHAPLMRIWGGTTASAALSGDERRRLALEAKEICDIAGEAGIKVALEWHKETVTDTNESALAFLDEVDSDNLYCLWQPTVALSMEERCAGIDMLEERDRLLNLHVYHWEEGVRRPFAEGRDEWRTYLSHVDMDRERFGLLEFVMGDTREQLLEDAAVFRELIA